MNSAAADAVKEKLATPSGPMLCAPAFVKMSREVMGAVVFNPGIKENAGIFNHTQGWGVIAETILGNGDRALEYCKAMLPASYNDKAEIRQSEPYVVGQTTYSTYSPRPGNTRVSWLSGAATWNYYSITQYILGIRPQYDGLLLDPCISKTWDGFKVERRWRGMNLSIEVKNPSHVCKGIASIEVDGSQAAVRRGNQHAPTAVKRKALLTFRHAIFSTKNCRKSDFFGMDSYNEG